MIVEARTTISGAKAAIWATITDIANAASIIRGIERIEIVGKPDQGLVGLKWRETRMLFGKPVAVEKWITQAVENEFYETRAESDGFVFVTTMRLSQAHDGVTLTSSHDSRPQGLVATLQAIPMKLLFKGVIRKAILEDLQDIEAAVASSHALVGPARGELVRALRVREPVGPAAFGEREFAEVEVRGGRFLAELAVLGVAQGLLQAFARGGEMPARDVEQADALLDAQQAVVVVELAIQRFRLLPVHERIVELAEAERAEADVVEALGDLVGQVELLAQRERLAVGRERGRVVAAFLGDHAAVVGEVGEARAITEPFEHAGRRSDRVFI